MNESICRNIGPGIPAIVTRAQLLRAVRAFFDADGFVEVTTPVVVKAPAPEEYIEAPLGGKGFLRTSPELDMKRLVAEGMPAIYQIGPCFREGETGRLHNEEFTMLEWYRAGSDYRQLLDFTRDLVISAVRSFHSDGTCRFRNHIINFTGEWDILTVHEAFSRYAGMDPETAIRDHCFEEVLVEKIEPHLGMGRPTVLIDYPARFAALARKCPGRPHLAERWELYLGGVEIANAYSELTDGDEQRQRFIEAMNARKADGLRPYPMPTAFLEALEKGMPECAGCALGFDRLLMVLLDASHISEVLPVEP